MCALGSLNADYCRARTTRRRTGVPLAYYATVEARGLAQKACICRRALPQDLRCLRSRCVAVRWIQPSDLHVTIEGCSSPSAEPPVPATVHWRQKAAFTSRTRDRQSSYNPQLCCVRAHSKRGSAISRRPLVDSRSDARCVLACLPREGHGHFQRDLWNHPHHPALTPPNPSGCCHTGT